MGFKEIDRQHRWLVNALMEFSEVPRNKVPKEELEKMFSTLEDYIGEHFVTEEKYFEECGYDGAENHIEKHREFSEKIAEMKEGASGREIETYFDLIYFIKDWLVDHLVKEDREYAECFGKCGLE